MFILILTSYTNISYSIWGIITYQADAAYSKEQMNKNHICAGKNPKVTLSHV